MRHGMAMWRRLSPVTQDAVLAVVTAVLLVYGSYGEGHPANASDRVQFRGLAVPQPSAAVLLVVVVACLALAWRRRWPVAVLAVSTAAVAGYTLLGYVNGAAALAPVLAMYAVATHESARKAVAAGVAALAVLMTVTAAVNPFGHITGGGFYLLPGLAAAAVFGGIAITSRRSYVASIHDRAQQDARRRIDEERLRIARELHDVVAHTMATINVQAGTAAHVLTGPAGSPGDPQRAISTAADALQAIKTASKEGLRELRAILNLLRQADEADPNQPAPGITQLETLIEGARRAGLETRLNVTGQPQPLPPAVDMAAYRIVQESLTNAIRHAGPATAAVTLGYQPGELRIDVTDTGRGLAVNGSSEGTGHGLAGMRERAAAAGGTVETGPGPGGGYRVAARLPLPGTPATAATDSKGASRPAQPPARAAGTGHGTGAAP